MHGLRTFEGIKTTSKKNFFELTQICLFSIINLLTLKFLTILILSICFFYRLKKLKLGDV